MRTDFKVVSTMFQALKRVHMTKIVSKVVMLTIIASLGMPVLAGTNNQQTGTNTPPPVIPDPNPTPAPTPSSLRVIDSTFNGLWFDPSRDGEGFGMVISETTVGPTVVVSYYTYNDQKQTIFFIGSQSLPPGTTTVSIPVDITSGAEFGNAFKPADVVRTPAGTLSFSFTSCNSGIVDYELNNLGTGSLSVVRLIGVEGLDCS